MKKLSERAEQTLKFLGDFGPTLRVSDCDMKGYMYDSETDGCGKVYLSATEFRAMAEDFIEVAEWLEERAANDH